MRQTGLRNRLLWQHARCVAVAERWEAINLETPPRSWCILYLCTKSFGLFIYSIAGGACEHISQWDVQVRLIPVLRGKFQFTVDSTAFQVHRAESAIVSSFAR